MVVAISQSLLVDLTGRAAASPDSEVCGLLLGDDYAISAAVATANVAADPAIAFEIDPQALIGALRAQRLDGPRVIGCYHSHPSGKAEPSARDAATAEAGSLWLILGAGEARLWLAGAEGFSEVAIAPV